MARVIIDASYGPSVKISLNGAITELTPGQVEVVTLDQIALIEDAGLTYERVWRSTNDTLAALTLDEDEVAEDAAVDTVVGTLVGLTAGSTFEMTDDASGLFALDGEDVVVAGALDFETAEAHDIEITETNDEIETSPRATTIQIAVTNVLEVTLVELTLDESTVAEDAEVETVVGAIVGKTAGSTLSLTDDAGGLFDLDGLNIRVAGALDFETAASHNITVRETHADSEDSPKDTVLEITVTDVDEVAPTITSAATANNEEGTVLAHALTADEDVTWAITGGVDAAQFEISGSTLRWAANGVQDFSAPADDDTDNDYEVEVTATDTALNASTPQQITVTVTDAA